ncbi:MAG: AAA family ATPase [Caldisericia bacterium]|nr:AAA family ATPase [Caldisericia bacterium]MDD4614604.1 AAA family ATPase [Caldisericia bacterium]
MNLKNTIIRSLHVANYRTLKSFRIDSILPFTVFLGKNGSGKSTILDSLSFLSNCITNGLKNTCKKKGGIHELLSKDSSESLMIQVELYDDDTQESLWYSLYVAQENGNPYVKKECVTQSEDATPILLFESGTGMLCYSHNGVSHEQSENLVSKDVVALSIFGSLGRFEECHLIYQFLLHLRVFDFQVHTLRQTPSYEQEFSLSQTGDNIANVLYTIQNHHPDIYYKIIQYLQEHIPSLEKIEARYDPLLNINQIFMTDKGFPQPIGVNYISSGIIKMLAYYILLLQPNEHSFIGLEEPENYIHPSFISDLAEFCRESSEAKQIAIATHSPFFVNAMNPGEVWACKRNEMGITVCDNLVKNNDITTYVENGAKIGYLWSEGYVEE